MLAAFYKYKKWSSERLVPFTLLNSAPSALYHIYIPLVSSLLSASIKLNIALCRSVLHSVTRSSLTLCNPTVCIPSRLLCPWDLPGKWKWAAFSFSSSVGDLVVIPADSRGADCTAIPETFSPIFSEDAWHTCTILHPWHHFQSTF